MFYITVTFSIPYIKRGHKVLSIHIHNAYSTVNFKNSKLEHKNKSEQANNKL